MSGSPTRAANFTDISCWDDLHLQFFLCVNVFSDNWPCSPRRCSAESSPLPGQCCTCYCVVLWIGYIVCSYVPNSVMVCSQPCRNHHCPYLAVNINLCYQLTCTSGGLSSQCASRRFLNVFTVLLSCQDNDYSFGWRADYYWFTRLQAQDDQQVHELLSHGWISHWCSCKYYPRCWKRERVISGHSSCVTIAKNYLSFQWKFGTVDHNAPVCRIVTGIVDFHKHSRLSLGLLLLLKTATSGEEHMRNNVYN